MTPRLLDLTGLKCPLPVLRILKALRGLAMGEAIEVHCTDPLAGIDVPHAVRQKGAIIESQHRDGGALIFIIRKTDTLS